MSAPMKDAVRLSETDLLKVKLLIAQRDRVSAQYQAQMLALQIDESDLHRRITEEYGIVDGDQLNPDTGAIVRVAAREKQG